MNFTLSPGIWEYCFKDKETNKPLSPKLYAGEFFGKTTIDIIVPEDLINNKNAYCFIQRCR